MIGSKRRDGRPRRAVEELRDVGVPKLRQDLPLALEALAAGGLDRRAHHLERDLSRELPVVALGEVHRAHAALAEQVLDLVLALDQALQPGLEHFHRPGRLRVRAAARLVGSAGKAEPAVVGQRRVTLDALRYRCGYSNLLEHPITACGMGISDDRRAIAVR